MMTNVLQLYHYLNDELADDRTKDWPFISSPLPTALITLSYLYFVLKCGPRYMKNRRPYSCINTFMRFYNIFQIAINSWVAYIIFENGWHQDIFLKCVEITYATDPVSMQYASIGWYYMILKLIDYIDTIVFVLRKKQQQVTFLHLYHHVVLAVLCWYQVKYYPRADIVTAMVMNCVVHIIMYTYYMLSSMGPTMRAYTDYIKPWITRIQMAQFVFLITYAGVYFLACGGPGKPTLLFLFLTASNLALFWNFYKQAYSKTKKNK